jgi:hypothetical protein
MTNASRTALTVDKTPAMERAKRAVIAVGIGRGFVVEGRREKLCVITAAHCLPHLPAEFLEMAWKVAIDKARELGWIV